MEQLLSPKTLSDLLGLAEQTIYTRHSSGGDLPAWIKLGRLLRFRPADVEAWLKRQEQTTPRHGPPARPESSPSARRMGRPTKAEQVAMRRSQSN